MIMAVSCQKINSDPQKGAEALCSELQSIAPNEDYDKAQKLLVDYWNAYQGDNKNEFLYALREQMMDNDKVVDFMVQPDFKQYPIFGEYMKGLQMIAFAEALENSKVGSPASKGILFGSLMADYADTNDVVEAHKLIATTSNNLRNSSELTRIEFFASFRQFIQTSGEQGIKAFKFLNSLKSPEYTAFQRLALESFVEYE